ncbi:MAG: hypothetical protein COT81_03825 [Candidatus Buchananbacteria bacterium CG10_big_fil_rev_8_21_14_0_10_42_9]|uniref:Uncharacterized protein n=1 Tax=Candidatus Buchananbacteria bacterium CG10_big_fil_rev_8_21_14_0_10_42_9 TaxID=1974526 RepID=A0A2H0W2R2_9BACT|nr:MAG: hypothetical protein COT81_03825 [Candidatus Buchananbacteria bacterium CG10_big_fil_rev_8_21_14_0_10_42_9]
MAREHTPAEEMQALANKERHAEGRRDAEFYGVFLDSVADQVREHFKQTQEESADLKLRDVGINEERFKLILQRAHEKAIQDTNHRPKILAS